MRPVDQLVSILKSLVERTSTPDNFTLDEFEEFAIKYSLQEACNMLI